MTNLEKHLLREYKKSGLLKIERVQIGDYNIAVFINKKYNWYHASSWTESGEWIIKSGRFQDDNGIEDTYCFHADTLQDAQFEIAQF